MKVQEIMSTDPETCRPDDTLGRAAQIMWEHDCGAVPVVDAEAHVIGMLTDRDICMAAYTQGRPLSEISVSSACSRIISACKANDPIESVEALMSAARVRRIPVTDHEDKLCGIVSIGDLAQQVQEPTRKRDGLSYESIATTIAAISQPAVEHRSNGASRRGVGRTRATTSS
jgi:CBS-domain-containing membrane protein